jgi:hypothetical protein
MILAPWIDDQRGAQLRKAGIFYADEVGNAWICFKRQKILIDVRGRRPSRKPEMERGRILEPAGLKVLHLLLTREGAINRTYREMAQEAGVALGTVAAVMRDLRSGGFLLRTTKRKRRLNRRPDLIELFVRGYALKLRPAAFLGRFRHEEADPRIVLRRFGDRFQQAGATWALAGAMAARRLTPHLEPDTLALFVDRRGRRALDGERMLPDAGGGNVILFDLFSPSVLDQGSGGENPIATPLLVYAELLFDGRPREVETAESIYERFVVGDKNQ